MLKKIIALITSFFIVEQVASASQTDASKILLNTSKGEIVIKLLPEFAPEHIARIIELVKSELIAKNKAIEDTKQKIEKDKQIEDLKIQAFINDAKVMRSEIEIDKYKFNYSDKWELINRSDKSITLQGTDSNFVFNISETPSSQIVDFTSYLIQSSDLNLLSKKISLNLFMGKKAFDLYVP